MTIWKYPLQWEDATIIQTRVGAQPLCVGSQGGIPTVWMLLNPDAPIEVRRIFCRGTGHPINDPNMQWRYIGTIHAVEGALVFHFFDGGAV